jgi:hypothetical protein
VSERWLEGVPVLTDFAQSADVTRYAALPDDWSIGVTDVVDSTGAIEAGRYKAVNLAGAGVISAVTNALDGQLRLFVFGGDGARFAASPSQTPAAAEALRRTAMWAERDLGLTLRVGMVTVAEIRAAGFDARTAFWQTSPHVRYAMFAGGGLEWAEARLKNGDIGLDPAAHGEDPDLSGLSCQWGPLRTRQGKILSLIVKPAPGAAQARFVEVAAEVVAVLESGASLNPVAATGPDVEWPGGTIALQSRIARSGRPGWWRYLGVLATTGLSWLLFKTGLRVGEFDPERYRREIAANTDYRKFDDALLMTVDCAPDTVSRLRAILDEAVAAGAVRYGLHLQDEALMTCFVTSVLTPDHMHFVDGAGGGYAAAARQLRT